MSGHSHWASIKHKKETTDAKKGKAFSTIAKMLMIAARDGGGDPNMNLKLQYAMTKAREVNMPRENIERAIKKGTGELAGTQIESVTYEGYGPGGVALMIETVTDNRKRTVSEIRKILESKGGSLGNTNCVSWLFERKGFFTILANTAPEDKLLSLALEIGADDAQLAGDVFEITCQPKDFERVKELLTQKGIPSQTAEITQIPKNYVTVDETTGKKLLELTDTLEEHDDVQNIYANFDIPQEVVVSELKRQGA